MEAQGSLPEAPAGAQALALIRGAERATLATSLQRAEAPGWPYASLVLVATAADAAPLLLLSDLADHSQNIARDARVSLLFDGTAGLAEPLTGPRLTLLGRAAECRDEAPLARYLRRHPSAEFYSKFKDFRLYRVTPERAHLVAGFGRIHWLEGTAFLAGASAPALAAAEADVLAHLNADHGEALGLMAHRLLGLAGEGWSATGIDPHGLDLRAGGELARLAFKEPIHDAGEARAALVELARAAREQG